MEDEINIIVTSLPEYVEQNRDSLVRRVVLGGRTISHMVPQPGIKTKAAINYLDVDPEFQDGRGCRFTPQEGGVVLTQREISTGIIKVNFTICPDTLLGKYAEFLVKIKATEEEFPFERFIIEDTIAKINNKLEKAIWQGDTTSADANINKFDGLLKLARGEAETITVNFPQNASVWDKIKAVIKALPDEALETGRCAVFVGTEVFRDFMLELVEKNFYHYDGAHDEAPLEFVFPGTNVTVVSTVGLSRTGVIYATAERNLYYGFDMMDAKETVEVIWDAKNKEFDVWVKWNSGVQTAFPDLVVVGGPTDVPGEVTISGPDRFDFPGAGGSVTSDYLVSDGLGVVVDDPAEGGIDWIHPTVNGSRVTFAIDANPDETSSRSTGILVYAASNPEVYMLVTISQAEGTPAPAGDGIIGPDSISIPATPGNTNPVVVALPYTDANGGPVTVDTALTDLRVFVNVVDGKVEVMLAADNDNPTAEVDTTFDVVSEADPTVKKTVAVTGGVSSYGLYMVGDDRAGVYMTDAGVIDANKMSQQRNTVVDVVNEGLCVLVAGGVGGSITGTPDAVLAASGAGVAVREVAPGVLLITAQRNPLEYEAGWEGSWIGVGSIEISDGFGGTGTIGVNFQYPAQPAQP